MKAVVQRVSSCSVKTGGDEVGRIEKGLLVLLGVAEDDKEKDADYLAEKIANLRIFEDGKGKMNLSLLDIGAEMMVVSQFTLLGDCRKGRRPSFINAAPPERAKALYTRFVRSIQGLSIRTSEGVFGAKMDVELVNDGPVTLILNTRTE